MQDRYVGDIGDSQNTPSCAVELVCRASDRCVLLSCGASSPTRSTTATAAIYHISVGLNSRGWTTSYLLSCERSYVQIRECISAVAAGGVLPCGTVFYDAPAASPKIARLTRTERARHRLIWLENCLGHTDGGELVFFDPDNGFEVPSVPKHHPNAGKYIYWDELAPFCVVAKHYSFTIISTARCPQLGRSENWRSASEPNSMALR